MWDVNSLLLGSVVLIPLLIGLGALLIKRCNLLLRLIMVGSLVTSVPVLLVLHQTLSTGVMWGMGNALFVDELSAFNLIILLMVYNLSSFYAQFYFAHEIAKGNIARAALSRFVFLWQGTLAAMLLVLLSNNLAVMWISLEVTTLFTTFMICTHQSKDSLEAMWKYLMICSVGLALAFIGTLLVCVSAQDLGLPGERLFEWSQLYSKAKLLSPGILKIGFIFILIGYGTKAGLAPMHTWLPDAHGQAPAPVSAIFSGLMLNLALYCISRFIPLVEINCGYSGQGRVLLMGLGLISIVIAAVFILFQKDLKRLLAYSSVEHLGIVAMAISLGGLGSIAALYHTFNHSLCKSFAFFSAGRLGQHYGTYRMDKIRGTFKQAPLWGVTLFVSLLALIGMAPLAIFMSKLQIIRVQVQQASWFSLIVLLMGTATVFIGILQYIIPINWNKVEEKTYMKISACEYLLVGLFFIAVVLLGVWMPKEFFQLLSRAAAIINGGAQ